MRILFGFDTGWNPQRRDDGSIPFQAIVRRHRSHTLMGLLTLVAGEFVYEAGLPPEVDYVFKHALTQEVAYNSQLGEPRARIHGAVARAIEDLHPDRLEERAALLAHHWEGARDAQTAARWHVRAARGSTRRRLAL